jgi:hypothetical protein
MGFLGLFLIHRLLLIWVGLLIPVGCLWTSLIIILGPLTILFIFIWNIVGTVFLVQITRMKDRDKCISTGSLVADWIIVSMIYLIYMFIFFFIYFVIKKVMEQKKASMAIKNKLKQVYLTILKPEESISQKEITKNIKECQELLRMNKVNIDKFPLFCEEENVMRLFYIPEINQNQRRISEVKDNFQKKLSIVNMDQNDSEDGLTEPLLKMINKNPLEKQMNKRMTDIQNKVDENAEDCIICFCELDDPLKKMVLKCRHKFHEKCIFDWLKVKPTCPMCRKNVRLDLLSMIIEHLEKLKNKENIKFEEIEEVDSTLVLMDDKQ